MPALAPCYCGGCSQCLHDQGYAADRSDDAEGPTECSECGAAMTLEERLSNALECGPALCDACAAASLQEP